MIHCALESHAEENFKDTFNGKKAQPRHQELKNCFSYFNEIYPDLSFNYTSQKTVQDSVREVFLVAISKSIERVYYQIQREDEIGY